MSFFSLFFSLFLPAAAAEKGQSPSSLSSVMLQSVGLRDVDLRRDRSEAAFNFSEGRGGGGWSREGMEQTKALLFDRMIKLGLPPNQDIDLRKRPSGGLQDKADYLEVLNSPGISITSKRISPTLICFQLHNYLGAIGMNSITVNPSAIWVCPMCT